VSSDDRTMPKPPRLLSPITRRILAVNVLALAFLVTAVLYLEEYRKGLIEAKLESLKVQADMFAVALAEGTVATSVPGVGQFTRETARQMMHRLVEASNARARLFASNGELILDSRRIGRAGGDIQVEILPPPQPDLPMAGAIFDLYDSLIYWLPGRGEIPRYEERPIQHGSDYAEVTHAIRGEKAGIVRANESGRMVLSVAVPVQRYKQVLGALMLSSASHGIEEALLDVRLDILKIFAVALALTILVSTYLASTIAHPILRLAQGAESVRSKPGREQTIPDLTKRDDEIGELSGAMRDMTEALWRRMDAIESFAADVSHELKNPLTSLRSAVETVGKIKDEEKRRHLMEIILQDVDRLDRLISDISDASRLDSELSRASSKAVDLAALLTMLVDIHKSTHEENGQDQAPKIHMELPDNKPLLVRGFEDRLVQVFQNLISNGLSFSPENGTLGIRVEREKTAVVVKIEDEGPGLPKGKEHRIFERFYSERPSGEDFGKHSGLGLSISKQIVESLGGILAAENRHGGAGQITGARFIVRLVPADPPTKAEKKKEKIREEQEKSKRLTLPRLPSLSAKKP